mmetsp:Transcript_15160/g.37005  ORF Transcript_15160/g.37005 Transcript_15160/m.37005 type:complete len:139 (-) Transcript_15160:233-649(-)
MGILHLNAMRLAAPLTCASEYASAPPTAPEAEAFGGGSRAAYAPADMGTQALPVSALFVTASLFNHSCAPNISVAFGAQGDADSGRAVFSFVANKEILPGTECSISYCDTQMSTKDRVEHLWWAYGFQCTCRKCAGYI